MLLSGVTITFIKQFALGLWLTFPMLLSIAVGIVVLGRIAGKIEHWPKYDSFYWSFITATTVGYGDLRPTHRSSRLFAIVIALMGLTMTGIFIAVAVHAATLALGAHDAAINAK